jgi:hypothetical protein
VKLGDVSRADPSPPDQIEEAKGERTMPRQRTTVESDQVHTPIVVKMDTVESDPADAPIVVQIHTVESDPADPRIVVQIARVALVGVMIAIAAWLVTSYALDALSVSFLR